MTAVPDVVRPAGQSDRWRLLAEKLAPNATRLDLDYFAEAAHHLQLTPFSNPPEIVLIDRYDNRLGRTVYRPQVTVDGRLALARRTGKVVGIEGPHYTGPRQKWTDRDGQRIWIDAWDCEDEGGHPRAARYLIHIAGDVVPVNGTAPWSEFAQRDKKGELLKTWADMPTTMLSKCALSLGLRRSGIEKLPADIPVDYEGDGSIDIIEPEPVETHEMIVTREDKDGDTYRCSCGRLFNTVAAFHAHKTPGPVPPPAVSATAVDAGASHPPVPAPTGPGPSTFKSRKPSRRPVETGPPVDYYDNLPEAQGHKLP